MITLLFLTLNKNKWGARLIFPRHRSDAVHAFVLHFLYYKRRPYTIKIMQATISLQCFQCSWFIEVLSMSKIFHFRLEFSFTSHDTKMVIIFGVIHLISFFFFEFVQFVNHSFLFFIFNLHSNTIFWFIELYIVYKIIDSSLIYLKISKYNILSRALEQNKTGIKKWDGLKLHLV